MEDTNCSGGQAQGLGLCSKGCGDSLGNLNRGYPYPIYIVTQALCLSKGHGHPSPCSCEKPDALAPQLFSPLYQ